MIVPFRTCYFFAMPVEPASAYTPVPVVAAWDETAALHGLTLALPPELARLHQAPGQVVKLRGAAGEGYFAIASAPSPNASAGERIDLLLKRGAPVADALLAAATVGARLETSPPFGRGFPLDEARGRELLLFAAGSGISPIRALVQAVLAERERYGRVALFYGQRGHEEFAYLREQVEWARAGVHVVLCASKPNQTWEGPRGYVQEVAESLSWLEIDPSRAVAFLCGMKPMVSGVREVLERAGVGAGRVFLNY